MVPTPSWPAGPTEPWIPDPHERCLRDLLSAERGSAFAVVRFLAQSLSPDEQELWELTFLHAAAALADHGLRVRAMEVYACLKVAQAEHCVPFPGYVGDDAPI
jgi:hypothetical protein